VGYLDCTEEGNPRGYIPKSIIYPWIINSYMGELRSLAQPQHNPNTQASTVRAKAQWIPPPKDIVKFNVDASVSKTEARGVAAAFCRDVHGNYLGASAVVFRGITDPVILEALACREAQALADDLNCSKFFVASDCKMVVSDIQEGSMRKHGSIISEIKNRSLQFQECNFSYESRVSNFEAHNLARTMLSHGVGRHIWLGVPSM
jgi:hypothetical protein